MVVSLIAVQSTAEIKADFLILGILFEGKVKYASGGSVDGKVEDGTKFVDGKDDVVNIDKKLVNLKKSVLFIGRIQPGETVNGESFLTIMAEKWEIFIVSYILIKNDSLSILILEAATYLLLK